MMEVYLDSKNLYEPYEFDFDLLKDQRDDNGNTWEEDVEEAAYMDEYDGVIARNAENDDSGKKRTIIFTFEQGQIKVSTTKTRHMIPISDTLSRTNPMPFPV